MHHALSAERCVEFFHYYIFNFLECISLDPLQDFCGLKGGVLILCCRSLVPSPLLLLSPRNSISQGSFWATAEGRKQESYWWLQALFTHYCGHLVLFTRFNEYTYNPCTMYTRFFFVCTLSNSHFTVNTHTTECAIQSPHLY